MRDENSLVSKLWRTVVVALLALLIPLQPAWAGDTPRDDRILRSASDDQHCAIEDTPLVRCEKFDEFKKQDSRLNASYQALRASFGKDDAKTLKNMQRKWIAWRDDTCDNAEAAASCTNGMCVGVAHDSCIVRLTERRWGELDSFKADLKKSKAAGFNFSKAPPARY